MTTSEQAFEALRVLAMDPDESVETYQELVLAERRARKAFCEALRTGEPAPDSEASKKLADKCAKQGDRLAKINNWMGERFVTSLCRC